MNDKKYNYRGKEYGLRNKSFKPYRIKALKFMNDYDAFERKYTAELQGEINSFLFNNKKIQGKVITAKNNGDNEKLNEIITGALLENPQYAIKVQELANKKKLATELFLTTNDKCEPSELNAIELVDIMLENAGEIKHECETEEEYFEYLNFLKELFDDFFLKFRLPMNT